MYGNMALLRAEANQLRTVATEMRARASAMKSQATAMQWDSSSARMFQSQIDLAVLDLRRCASEVDAAADAVVIHARAVDTVKEAIATAQQFVQERLNDARHVVTNVVKGVGDTAEAAVNFLFGNPVSDWFVDNARSIISIVPVPPPVGSLDWLDAQQRIKSHG